MRSPTWAAVVVPIWIVMILCTHWEPVQRDGWGHYMWHEHFTADAASSLYDFAKRHVRRTTIRASVRSLTFLMFTPGPWHEIFTPVARARDVLSARRARARTLAAHAATTRCCSSSIVAIVAVTAPQFGADAVLPPVHRQLRVRAVHEPLVPGPVSVRGACALVDPMLRARIRVGPVQRAHRARGRRGSRSRRRTCVAARSRARVEDRRHRRDDRRRTRAVLRARPGRFATTASRARLDSARSFADRGLSGNLEVVGALVRVPVAGAGVDRDRRASRASLRRPAHRVAASTSSAGPSSRSLAAAVAIVVTLLAVAEDRPAAVLRARSRLRCVVIASIVVRQLASRWRDGRLSRPRSCSRTSRCACVTRLSRGRRPWARPGRDAGSARPTRSMLDRRAHGRASRAGSSTTTWIAARVSSGLARRDGVRSILPRRSSTERDHAGAAEAAAEDRPALPPRRLAAPRHGPRSREAAEGEAADVRSRRAVRHAVRRRARRRRSTTICARSTSRCR